MDTAAMKPTAAVYESAHITCWFVGTQDFDMLKRQHVDLCCTPDEIRKILARSPEPFVDLPFTQDWARYVTAKRTPEGHWILRCPLWHASGPSLMHVIVEATERWNDLWDTSIIGLETA